MRALMPTMPRLEVPIPPQKQKQQPTQPA